MEDRAAEDLRLVRSVLDGEVDAFGPIVQQYQRMVASVAWRYGVRGDEIEDVVSEVMIKAFEKLHRYRPEHPFSTWLYRLAANHVVDHGRRKRRERGRSEMPADLADPSPACDEGIERDERAVLLREALQEVAPHYREALFLVYIEGMKVDEAATALGLPQGTIKTRLMRGRRRLQKILERSHPEHFGASRELP